jgi:hypothetical protein
MAGPPIEILQQTAAHLIVTQPAEPWNIWFLITSAAFLAMAVIMPFRLKPQGMPRLVGILFRIVISLGFFAAFLGFLIPTLAFAGSSYQASFSKPDDVVLMKWSFFGRSGEERRVPLSSIRYAALEERRGDHRLVLITKTGEVILPVNPAFTDSDGYYRVKDAINDFVQASKLE